VLANEEVHDGKYIETGDPVEKRLLTQWMLRITQYADRLVDDLAGLEWPYGTLRAQQDWIGKSIGSERRVRCGGREGIDRGVHDAPGHAVRRHVRRARARASARRQAHRAGAARGPSRRIATRPASAPSAIAWSRPPTRRRPAWRPARSR